MSSEAEGQPAVPPTFAAAASRTEIEHCLDKLHRAVSDLGKDGYREAWLFKADESVDRLAAAVERYYERVINSFVELTDLAERVLVDSGGAPRSPRERTLTAEQAAAWWAQAVKLGLDAADCTTTNETPGRWRRGAVYCIWEHKEVALIAGVANTRNLFQHGYGLRSKERADETFGTIVELHSILRPHVDALLKRTGSG